MINRRTLGVLALITLALIPLNVYIGEDRDFLWIVDDIAFYGFLLCLLLLVVMTVAVLARAVARRGSPR